MADKSVSSPGSQTTTTGTPGSGAIATDMSGAGRTVLEPGRGSGAVVHPQTAPSPAGADGAAAQSTAAGTGGGAAYAIVDGGGPVLTQVQVELIFWGAEWTGASSPSTVEVRDAVARILSGPYMTGLTQYRGVGTGGLGGLTVTSSSKPPNPFSDTHVMDLIAQQIEAGRVPPPHGDRQILYCVVMPRDIRSDQYATRGLLGEHYYFVHRAGQRAHFAWLTWPRIPGGPGGLDDITSILTHELAEACTDPEGDGIQIEPSNPDHWNEIGDVCYGMDETVNGVRVQTYWSHRDRACIAPHKGPVSTLPHWVSLGGKIDGGMVAINNQDGRLEILARNPHRQLCHLHQTRPNDGWSKTFESLGGHITGRIVALSNSDGRIGVFARGTDSALWHLYQSQPNKGWSTWLPLEGGSAHVPIDDLFAGARNRDGRLALFARRPDGVLLHRSQMHAGGEWDSWAPLDQAVKVSGALAVTLNQDGRLELFARDAQGAVHHIWQTSPGSAWSTWAPMGFTSGRLLAVGRNKDGCLVVFGVGTDNALWHVWQQQPGKSESWNKGWMSLGGRINQVLSVASNKDGRLVVFARGDDGALWHLWQEKPNGSWAGTWASLGGKIADLLTVGVNKDHRLEIFARDDNGAVHHIWQIIPGGDWNT